MSYDIPIIPGIDWEKAHNYLPDKETLVKVLEETVRSCMKQTQLLSVLKSAVLSDASENNFSAYRTQAHAMKATLRTVGSDLFDMALSLEEAGRDGNVDVIRDDTDAFIAKYKQFAESLKNVVGDCDKGKAFDKNEFVADIAKLRTSMEAFDVNALQQAFEDVLRMDLPEKYKDVIVKLEKAVRELDSEEVIVCCDEILKGDD